MSDATGTRGRAVPPGQAGAGGRGGRGLRGGRGGHGIRGLRGGRGGFGARGGVAVAADAVVGLVVTAVLLAGLARPGFPLLRDWVATPRPPLSDAALGLGESAARAVPQDVALAWASRALAGVGLPVWPLTGLLTVVFCVWLAVSAGALVRLVVPGICGGAGAGSTVGSGAALWLRLPAVVGAVWNPFVVERLLQGHWSLLAGVAAVMTMPVLLARGPSGGSARPSPAAGSAAESWRKSSRSRWASDLCALSATFRPHMLPDSVRSGRISRRAPAPEPTPIPEPAPAPTPEPRPVLASGSQRIAGACVALAVAGLTPTGWVLAVVAAVVALACADATGIRRARAAAALSVVAAVTALPWLLATVLAGATAASGPGEGAAVTGVAAFAARAEPGIGTVGSVFTLAGIWNSEAVPPSRGTWWATAALALLLVVWALAARGLWRSRHLPAVRATVLTAFVTWLLVAFAATGPGISLLEAAVRAVPGVGLLRDTQKFVALALPATVLAFAFATRALAPRLRPIGAAVAVTGVVLAAVPDAPRALWDQLRPVTYGPGWAEVAAIVDGQPGDLLVLPAGSFRSTPLWADGRAVLDPAPRLLDTRVVVPGDLVVGGATVSGEGDRARRVSEALLRGEDPQVLASMGVRWVLDERTSAGPRGESSRTLAGTVGPEGAAEQEGVGPEGAAEQESVGPGAATEATTTTTTRFSDTELVLHELPPPDLGGLPDDADTWKIAMAELPVSAESAPEGDRAVVLAAHAAWLVALALALAVASTASRAGR